MRGKGEGGMGEDNIDIYISCVGYFHLELQLQFHYHFLSVSSDIYIYRQY